MKVFVALVMAIFAFAATIAGALYFSGGFTQEGMQKLLGIEAPKSQEAAPPSATSPEVVKALNERETELAEREAALKTEEKRIEETRGSSTSFVKPCRIWSPKRQSHWTRPETRTTGTAAECSEFAGRDGARVRRAGD